MGGGDGEWDGLLGRGTRELGTPEEKMQRILNFCFKPPLTESVVVGVSGVHDDEGTI